jgi:hypothetical protein
VNKKRAKKNNNKNKQKQDRQTKQKWDFLQHISYARKKAYV